MQCRTVVLVDCHVHQTSHQTRQRRQDWNVRTSFNSTPLDRHKFMSCAMNSVYHGRRLLKLEHVLSLSWSLSYLNSFPHSVYLLQLQSPLDRSRASAGQGRAGQCSTKHAAATSRSAPWPLVYATSLYTNCMGCVDQKSQKENETGGRMKKKESQMK